MSAVLSLFPRKAVFGLWHESRDSRVCVCCAVDTGIWKPRVDTVDKMTKSKFPIFLEACRKSSGFSLWCSNKFHIFCIKSRSVGMVGIEESVFWKLLCRNRKSPNSK